MCSKSWQLHICGFMENEGVKNREVRGMSKGKRHPLSVSATELSKLGSCEVMVALDLKDATNPELSSASARGNAEHDRFHVRAVLNAGTKQLSAKI